MASLNVVVAYDTIVKRAHYVLEISQNCECFNRGGGLELVRQSLEYFWNIFDKNF